MPKVLRTCDCIIKLDNCQAQKLSTIIHGNLQVKLFFSIVLKSQVFDFKLKDLFAETDGKRPQIVGDKGT